MRRILSFFICFVLLWAGATLAPHSYLRAQQGKIVWSDREKPLFEQLRALRGVPDDQRGGVTRHLALEIRQLSPTSSNRLLLASYLAGLSTEGDFGRDTLQEVTTTLAEALRGAPPDIKPDNIASAYHQLAALVRYEHTQVSMDVPQFAQAMAELDEEDRVRQSADFALTDLEGKVWALKDLRGKVVLVNFWATWCPPCRKEMPDLETLYQRFKDQGLVVLAISDEDANKVKPFLATRKVSYPVLLDTGRKVNALLHIEGIPKSFVYDRQGKLVAQAIDMRTQKQFLGMLSQAGLQ
jgi:thiol-disulfide isomerase/thioredoxin